MNKEISEEHLKKYFGITKEALGKIKPGSPSVDLSRVYDDFLDMATRYFSDAKHFFEKGEFVDALSAINYAHAWLDAGARIGVFDVGGDSRLFVVDKDSPGQS